MLEKSRITRRPEGEPTFNVFYQMLAGVSSQLRKELQLDNLNEPNLFMTPLQRVSTRLITVSIIRLVYMTNLTRNSSGHGINNNIQNWYSTLCNLKKIFISVVYLTSNFVDLIS